jgi:hypothetical protein
MLPRHAYNYEMTRLAKPKLEAPIRAYQYQREVPQRKTKETRLKGQLSLYKEDSSTRTAVSSMRWGLNQIHKT